MDFAEAIELSKKIPTLHPKIFIGFSEWGILDTETEGYVVFADAASAKESCFNEVKNHVKNNKLRIDQNENYLMIHTEFKFLGDK